MRVPAIRCMAGSRKAIHCTIYKMIKESEKVFLHNVARRLLLCRDAGPVANQLRKNQRNETYLHEIKCQSSFSWFPIENQLLKSKLLQFTGTRIVFGFMTSSQWYQILVFLKIETIYILGSTTSKYYNSSTISCRLN